MINIPKNIQAIIFDLDGTVFDSMGIWEQIDREFLGERNITIPDDYFDTVLAMSFKEVAAYTIERFGLPETIEELQLDWNKRAAKAYASTIELKPYVKEYILSLAQIYPLAVATSLPPELHRPALKRHGLLDAFELIVTTHEVGKGKDSPLIFQETAKRLGLKPDDCLLFEDVLEGITSAKAIDMPVIGVFDEFSAKDWEAIQQQADDWIEDFSRAPQPASIGISG